MKQDQYSPLPIEQQIIMVYSGVRGYLKSIPLDKIASFEQDLLTFVTGKDLFLPLLSVVNDRLKEFDSYVNLIISEKINSIHGI